MQEKRTGKECLAVCHRLTKTLIASMSGVTPLEVLVYGDVDVPDIDFVRDKDGCSSLSLEGFLTYISSVYFRHILVFCNYSHPNIIWLLVASSLMSFCVCFMLPRRVSQLTYYNSLFRSVPGHAIATSSNWSVVGHIVGIIERRRFVFQIEIYFYVGVGSLGSKPAI